MTKKRTVQLRSSHWSTTTKTKGDGASRNEIERLNGRGVVRLGGHDPEITRAQRNLLLGSIDRSDLRPTTKSSDTEVDCF